MFVTKHLLKFLLSPWNKSTKLKGISGSLSVIEELKAVCLKPTFEFSASTSEQVNQASKLLVTPRKCAFPACPQASECQPQENQSVWLGL